MGKATDYQKQYKNAIWVYWSRVISVCHPSVLKLQRIKENLG